MKLVDVPNLPYCARSLVVSGEISAESEYTLRTAGLELIKTRPEPILYNAVKYHPDMQFHHLGGSAAVCTPNMAEILPSEAELDISPIPEGKYPGDVLYNAARVGDFLICNVRYTSEKILEYCRSCGIEIICCAQGYAKCNACIVDKRSVITSDMSIARACAPYPIDVLFVDDSSVVLPGFSHGFFGGASGLLRRDLLAVNGDIRLHKSAADIIGFAAARDVEILSLTKSPPEDIGSITALTEI